VIRDLSIICDPLDDTHREYAPEITKSCQQLNLTIEDHPQHRDRLLLRKEVIQKYLEEHEKEKIGYEKR